MIKHVVALSLSLAIGTAVSAGDGAASLDVDTTLSCNTGVGEGVPVVISCREEAPGFGMRGPEFDNGRYRATWLEYTNEDLDEGLIYIAPVNRRTGAIDALNSESVFTRLAPPRATVNGPEWGDSQRGPEVYYSCLNSSGNRSKLCRIGPDYSVTEIAGTSGYSNRSVSANRNDAVPRLYYEARSNTLSESDIESLGFGIREATDDAEDVFLPGGLAVKGGRWLPNGRQVIYSEWTRTPDQTGWYTQIFIYDAILDRSFQLFDDVTSRVNPMAWEAPELGGKIAFTVIVPYTDGTPGWDMHVYRQTGGTNFVLWNVIPPVCPTTFPNNANPQPFVIDGKSHLVMVSVPGKNLNDDPGIISIASVDPSRPASEQVHRLISNDDCTNDGAIRKDPEAILLEDLQGNQTRARVYYTLRQKTETDAGP